MSYKEYDDGIVIFEHKRVGLAMDNNFMPTQLPSKVRMREYAKTFKWKPWGDNNLYPIKVKDAMASSAACQVCAETMIAYTYGRGIGVFKRVIKDGKEETIPATTTEHLKFFNANFIKDYTVRAITDYWWLANTFPQFVMNSEPNPANRKIALLRNIDAPFCRIGWQNESTLDIDTCYINGNWALLPSEKEIEAVKILDRYSAAEQIKAGIGLFEKDGKTPIKDTNNKYMYLSNSYTPGELYYHKHAWHASLDTGVIDLAPEIPKIRKARFKNALFVKYHVEIEEQYWEKAAGEKKWKEMKADERRELRTEVYNMIDRKLGGTDNAFKSLFSDKVTNAAGQVVNLISIKKIETDFGDSAAFDPDKMSNVADMFLAWGIPAPIMKTVLSDGKSQGGGSDMREGLIAMQMKLQLHRENILAPLEFMMRFNGLIEDDEYLNFSDIKPTTLDKNPTGQENTVA